tara:strand:+ start:91 stop:192 length:102 start_codon:yes stop_codon:yes gene_type:complete
MEVAPIPVIIAEVLAKNILAMGIHNRFGWIVYV